MSEISKVHCIGNAHLDPVWLWRWQEGCGEVLQTFRSALDRLNEYDDFVFTCSSAAYYNWVKEIDYPMFEEIRQRVSEGRWIPVNGWWVQPDCNIPSGESFARQALYSQLFYRENFGRICHTGYNVDSFGHNGNLPQLLRNGGMACYVMMRPSETENPAIPKSCFIWEGVDRSRVLTYRIPNTYAAGDIEGIDRELERMESDINETGHGVMLFYGVGNHGGGPTKASIEHLTEIMEREGYHELQFSSPDEFFTELCTEMVDLPTWNDDLQHHASGCYSATSLVKQLNRRSENELLAAEALTTIASKTADMDPSTEDFCAAWKEVCFNQFHDILCGCSIMEAYEDVKCAFGSAIQTAMKKYNEAVLRLSGRVDTWIDGVGEPTEVSVRHHSGNGQPRPVIVFNPNSFAVRVPVRTYHPSDRVRDCGGKEVIFQNVRSSRSNDSHLDTVFLADVPALGYATYWLTWFSGDEDTPESDVKTAEDDRSVTVENKYILAKFCKKSGQIVSLISKESGFDYACHAPLAVPTVIDDHTTDTWAHNVFKFHTVKGIMELSSIELVECGPARALVRVRHTFNHCMLTQDFMLAAEQKTLRVKCKALWAEDFTLLKTAFRLSDKDAVCTAEIPGAFIKRPANGEEEPHQKWTDLTFTGEDGARHGLSLLNDSKYSYDCPDDTLRLTLLRNVIFADHYSPRPAADFNFTDEGMQRFEYGIYLHEGEAECSNVSREALQFNMRPVTVPAGYHKGDLPQKKGYIDISKNNIVMQSVKFCEDGSGDVILRCVETQGKETHAAIVCDMLEAAFYADFDPCEVKTFRIGKDGKAVQVNFLEGIC